MSCLALSSFTSPSSSIPCSPFRHIPIYVYIIPIPFPAHLLPSIPSFFPLSLPLSIPFLPFLHLLFFHIHYIQSIHISSTTSLSTSFRTASGSTAQASRSSELSHSIAVEGGALGRNDRRLVIE